jgi:tetratricopeptide (TPR) repeat protein
MGQSINKTFKKSLLALILMFLFNQISFANSSLDVFSQYFKSSQYQKAINALDNISEKQQGNFNKNYLKALCYSRLQEYDQAILNFEIAQKNQFDAQDFDYEMGQALFANNNIRKARDAFKKSVSKKFNTPASLYYVAYTSQILEDYESARESYSLLLKQTDLDLKLKQVARFQLAETLFLIAKNQSKGLIDLEMKVGKFIIPMMKSSYELDKDTLLAADVLVRINELTKEFNLDPDILANGRKISNRRYSGSMSLKSKFDDNISLTNEENNTQASMRESYIFESDLYFKYDFVWLKKQIVSSPEFRFNFVEHSDRSDSLVYQNDTMTLSFNLKNKYEHLMRNQPASFTFDIDTSRILKDYEGKKNRKYYSHSLTFTFGETASIFPFGDSTIKFRYKNYTGKNNLINNHTNSISFDQTYITSKNQLIIGLIELSFVDNYNNSSTNTDSYLMRIDYIVPEIFTTYTLGTAMSLSLTDTKLYQASRGTEVNWNPSIDISKQISENQKFSLNYDFTKTTSKDLNYQYNKHLVSAEYKYSF